jgi:hypothetical protein
VVRGDKDTVWREKNKLQCSPVTRSRTLQWSAASSGRARSEDAYAMVVEINCSSLVPRAGRIRRRCPPPAPAPGPSPSEPPRAASNGGASRRICVELGVTSVGRAASPDAVSRAKPPSCPPCPTHRRSTRLAWRRCPTCPSSVAASHAWKRMKERERTTLRESYTSAWRDNEEGKKERQQKENERERIKKKRIGK